MPRLAQLTPETKLRPVQMAVIWVLWVVSVQLAPETKLLPVWVVPVWVCPLAPPEVKLTTHETEWEQPI